MKSRANVIAEVEAPKTFPYRVRSWQGNNRIHQETISLARSALTGIPMTRDALRQFCEGRGLPVPTVPIVLRPHRVLWRIAVDGSASIFLEFLPMEDPQQ